LTQPQRQPGQTGQTGQQGQLGQQGQQGLRGAMTEDQKHEARAALAKHMMVEMHMRKAMESADWATVGDHIFLIRGNQIHKLDQSLNVVKSADLPTDPGQQVFAFADEQQPGQQGGEKQMTRQELEQKLTQLHAQLPVKIQAQGNNLAVSHGQSILVFNQDLQVQQKSDLPAVDLAKACPVCEKLLDVYSEWKQGQQGGQGGEDNQAQPNQPRPRQPLQDQ
jgi:hypothetical protein